MFETDVTSSGLNFYTVHIYISFITIAQIRCFLGKKKKKKIGIALFAKNQFLYWPGFTVRSLGRVRHFMMYPQRTYLLLFVWANYCCL
jgi:hypothetical protein